MSTTEAGQVAELTRRSMTAQVVEAADRTAIVIPDETMLEWVEEERHADRPYRRKGTVEAHDAASLCRLVKDLGAEHGRVAIYADVERLRITAVLNDDSNGPGHAAWRDHRVRLVLQRTPEWKTWLDQHGKLMSQVDFAHYVEDNRGAVVDPPAADLLELAQTFEADTTTEFRSGARLKDGRRQLHYVENIEARGGQSRSIEIPDAIRLHLPLFVGSDSTGVTARFRYRINGGALKIGYVLDQAPDAERDSFAAVVAAVAAGSEIEPYRASAPEPRVVGGGDALASVRERTTGREVRLGDPVRVVQVESLP